MQRALEIDLFKYLLACMVIGLHCQFLAEFNARLSYLLVNGVFRIAVPCFFVLSGYFYNSSHFTSTLRRITLIYIIWMLIYLPFWAFDLPYDMRPAVPLWQDILYGYYHLWFLIALLLGLGLYHIIYHLAPKLVIPCLILSASAGLVLQYGHNYGILHIAIPYYCNALCFAYPFIALGALLRTHMIRFLPYTMIVIPFACAGLLLEASINYESLFVQRDVRRPFDVLISLYLLCPALCAAIIHRAHRPTSGIIGRISLYVYLIHPLVIIGIWQVATLSATPLALLAITISTLLSIIMAYMMRFIRQKR